MACGPSSPTLQSVPQLGWNLPRLGDFHSTRPFLNLMKTARGFTRLSDGLFPNVDANGWSTQDFSTVVMTVSTTGDLVGGVSTTYYVQVDTADAGTVVSFGTGNTTGLNMVFDSYVNGTQQWHFTVPSADPTGALVLQFNGTRTPRDFLNIRIWSGPTPSPPNPT